MSKSNLRSINSSPKSETIRLQEFLESEGNIDVGTYSPSISSFDENFNCDEMFIITIDNPHVDATTSALSNSDSINSDGNQFAARIPARSISRVIDEEMRQQIKDVCFFYFFAIILSFYSFMINYDIPWNL
ncbi:Elongation factor [Dirofilaria immitis]